MQSLSDGMESGAELTDNTTSTSRTVPEPSRSAQSNIQTANIPPATEERSYHQLATYPFAGDPEYQAGLASILGHPERPATPSEIASKPDLVLQAQCFYFSRKFSTPPINPAAYKAWRSSQRSNASSSDSNVEASSTSTISSSIQQQSSSPPQSQPQQQQIPVKATTPITEEPPPYPNSFAAIVDLITNNKPIPGIEEIPNTILELGSSKQDKATRRKKPWETSTDVENPSTSTQNTAILPPSSDSNSITASTITSGDTNAPISSPAPSVEKAKKTGEGVVRILQPNAIPDSGLIAKD